MQNLVDISGKHLIEGIRGVFFHDSYLKLTFFLLVNPQQSIQALVLHGLDSVIAFQLKANMIKLFWPTLQQAS